MSKQQPTAAGEWRAQWTVVLAACVGFSFMSFMTPAAGVFMAPLGKEFGWTRTQLSLGIAISGLLAILLAPLVGRLVDRAGARRLVLPGIVLTALAVAGFSLATASFALWLALWAIWGLCSLLILSTVWVAAVASVFTVARGLALGITMAGTALATVIAPPLANWLIDHHGWRAAFVWLGLGWGAVAFVLAYAFLFDRHNRPAPSPAETPVDTSPAEAPGLTVGEALRNSALWRIGLSTFLILTITIAVVVHQFPIIVEAGLAPSSAAWLVSLSGVAGIVGKLVTGSLIDRFHARWVGGLTLASTAIAYPLMARGIATPTLILLGVAISGYAAGTKIQLCGYLTARYAGMRNYGTVFGLMTSAISLASAVGPLLAGIAHDRYGSYAPLLGVGVVASLVSGGLILSLGRYPRWNEPASA